MKMEKIPKSLAALAVVLLLVLTTPANALFPRAYTALITAKGSMSLKSLETKEDFQFDVELSFSALVPNSVPPDNYENVEFHGLATVTRHGVINFGGILKVNGINFWVKFAIEKPEDPNIPEGIYSAQGDLSATISEFSPPPQQIRWVLMKGKITKYGENEAFGGIMVHAKISEENNWTKANGFFTLKNLSSLLPTKTIPINFSISCYYFTLINTTKTEINTDGKALYIEGYWNIWNRTVSGIFADTTEATITFDSKLIYEGSFGILSVTLSTNSLEPSSFKLQIEEMEDITGEVLFYHFRFANPDSHFNRMIGIPRGDFNHDGIVNILDIMKVAKAFNAKFGMEKYDFDLDINGDFVVNIIDLTAIAQEYGQQY